MRRLSQYNGIIEFLIVSNIRRFTVEWLARALKINTRLATDFVLKAKHTGIVKKVERLYGRKCVWEFFPEKVPTRILKGFTKKLNGIKSSKGLKTNGENES